MLLNLLHCHNVVIYYHFLYLYVLNCFYSDKLLQEELYQLKAEVEAQLSIIPEEKYEVAIEVLKNYEILDKKGKINA